MVKLFILRALFVAPSVNLIESCNITNQASLNSLLYNKLYSTNGLLDKGNHTLYDSKTNIG